MKMISVSSPVMNAVGYDPANRQMQIQFKNSEVYTFCGVPQHIFDNFLSAEVVTNVREGTRMRSRYRI